MRFSVAAVLAGALFATGCISNEIQPGAGTPSPDGGMTPDPGTPPAPGAPARLATFSGCMTQANWDAAQMGQWANTATEGGTVCASCHYEGLRKFYTNENNAQMFDYNRYQVFISGFFLDNGTAVVAAGDKLRLYGSNHPTHPTFNVSPNAPAFAALDAFVELTNANQACLGSDFPVPPGAGQAPAPAPVPAPADI